MDKSGIFWNQVIEYVAKYGISVLALTVLSGSLIGYTFHYFFNVLPLNRGLLIDEQDKEIDDKHDEFDKNQSDNVILVDALDRNNKNLLSGAFGSNVVASLRKASDSKYEDSPSERKQIGFIKTHDESKKWEMNKDDHESMVLSESKSSKLSDSIEESAQYSEGELLNVLGKLHGKLATAQLRVKTRKMEANMSAEERDDESRTKARQLESIMKLMMQNKEKFGLTNEDEIKEQLNMYNF